RDLHPDRRLRPHADRRGACRAPLTRHDRPVPFPSDGPLGRAGGAEPGRHVPEPVRGAAHDGRRVPDRVPLPRRVRQGHPGDPAGGGVRVGVLVDLLEHRPAPARRRSHAGRPPSAATAGPERRATYRTVGWSAWNTGWWTWTGPCTTRTSAVRGRPWSWSTAWAGPP